jgi:hypothetical protein
MINALIAELASTARRGKPHELEWQATVREQLIRAGELLSELGKYLELTEAPTLENLDPFRKLMLELGRILRILVDSGAPPRTSNRHLGQLLSSAGPLQKLHDDAFDRLDVYRTLLDRATQPAVGATGSPAEDAAMQDVLVERRRRAIVAIELYERRLRRLLSPTT